MAESGSRDLMPAADWSRLEKEYERRQQEILLEAEAAVKAREEALNQVTLCTKKIFTVLTENICRSWRGCGRSWSGSAGCRRTTSRTSSATATRRSTRSHTRAPAAGSCDVLCYTVH